MRVYRLDEAYEKGRKKHWSFGFKVALFFIALIWSVFLIDAILPFIYLNQYGIYPRHTDGLIGIFAAIFLHGGFSHIISNTLPLFLAIIALCGNYPRTAKKVFIYGTALTGLLVWLFARSANHIGASGLLYCLLSYIFFSGFFRKDITSIGLSLVLAFLYGSLIFGIIPNQDHVSWESHLFGFITGIFLAWIYRRTDIPIYKSWDEEE